MDVGEAGEGTVRGWSVLVVFLIVREILRSRYSLAAAGWAGSEHTKVIRRDHDAISELDANYRGTSDSWRLRVLGWSAKLRSIVSSVDIISRL